MHRVPRVARLRLELRHQVLLILSHSSIDSNIDALLQLFCRCLHKWGGGVEEEEEEDKYPIRPYGD
jgi:hypothetical protein